jgi:hypothetical protein
MAIPGTQKKTVIFLLRHLLITRYQKMAVSPYTATVLEEFGIIGIAGNFVDLTAELSVTSKTAGVFRLYRNA